MHVDQVQAGPMYASMPSLVLDRPRASGSSDDQEALITPPGTLTHHPSSQLRNSPGKLQRHSSISSLSLRNMMPRRKISMKLTDNIRKKKRDEVIHLTNSPPSSPAHASRSPPFSPSFSSLSPPSKHSSPTKPSIESELPLSLGDPFSIDFRQVGKNKTIRRVRIEYVDELSGTHPVSGRRRSPPIRDTETNTSSGGRIHRSGRLDRVNTISTSGSSSALSSVHTADQPLRPIRHENHSLQAPHGRLFLQLLGVNLNPGKKNKLPSRICLVARDGGGGRQITSELYPGDLEVPYELAIPTSDNGKVTLRVHRVVRSITPVKAVWRRVSSIRWRTSLSNLAAGKPPFSTNLSSSTPCLPIKDTSASASASASATSSTSTRSFSKELNPATPGSFVGGVMVTLGELEQYRGFAVIVPLGGDSGSMKLRGFYMPSIPTIRPPRSLEDALRRRHAHDAQFPDEPAYSGSLSQCGGGLRFWRERWFELRGRRLHARDMDTRTPRAWFDLRAFRWVRMTHPHEIPGHWGFVVGFSDGVEIRFQAKDQSSRDEWMRRIQEVGRGRRGDQGIWEECEDEATIVARMWGLPS